MAITRDQKRAQFAYSKAKSVQEKDHKDYKIAVNGLGSSIIRSGLSSTVAFLQRSGTEGAKQLLDHLGDAGIPGIEKKNHNSIADCVQRLDLDAYMLATRETLKVALWLKRAVQALY